MKGKAFFVDTTLCTACRGCQVACKQWNQLPATETMQWGSHQNPKDLSHVTWKLIRFNETIKDGKPAWYFFADQCRHCVEPPCSFIPDIPGAVVVDEDTGAVIHTRLLSRFNFAEVRESCPFNIPRASQGNNLFGKCTMCLDRVQNGLLPACVKTCPNGAMNFGDYEEMKDLAQKRLAERKKANPKAQVTGLDEVRVFYLLDSDPADYWEFAVASAPKMNRYQAMKRVFQPFKKAAFGRFA